MENASKALIIAGAILLAILLISLGIMIFNQAQDTVTNSGMTEAELTSFNNKFLKYEGNQKGTMVKSMMQEVKSIDANASDEHKITVNFQKDENSSLSPTKTTKDIDTKHTYYVVMGYEDSGRINTINIYYNKAKADETTKKP